MVELEGSYTFEAPQEVVWEAIQDPNVLAKVLPGCERLEQVGENEYKGELNIRIGPVQGNFRGTVILSDLTPPASYHIELEGQGRPGYINGEGDLQLDGNDTQTTLNYGGSAQLRGRIASVGQRLIDSTARSITRQGLESLDKQIQARLQPAPEPEAAEEAGPPSSAPEVAPPTTKEVATGVAKDVIADFVPAERQSAIQKAVVIGVALLAVLWVYRMLFKSG